MIGAVKKSTLKTGKNRRKFGRDRGKDNSIGFTRAVHPEKVERLKVIIG